MKVPEGLENSIKETCFCYFCKQSTDWSKPQEHSGVNIHWPWRIWGISSQWQILACIIAG